MVIYFIAAFFLAVCLSLFFRRVAAKLNIVDAPDGGRKLHPRAVPLLGGAALFLAFWAVAVFLWFYPVYGTERLANQLAGALVGGGIIMLIGLADDVRPFSPYFRLILTAIAAAITVALGLGLQKINNPLSGGFISLGAALGGAVSFVWLMGMMYTTKILDGLDGLSTGVAAIGALMIFLFTQTKQYYQPNVGLLALVFTGALLGFLLFNFYPARIFLGESGSLWIGFMLGVLAVISGGKLAIAVLVMAVPVLDLARVIWRRHQRGQSIFKGDREHLHFQLVDRGLSVRQAVILLYIISAALGALTLFLQSRGKVALLLLVAALMIGVGWWLEKAKITYVRGTRA